METQAINTLNLQFACQTVVDKIGHAGTYVFELIDNAITNSNNPLLINTVEKVGKHVKEHLTLYLAAAFVANTAVASTFYLPITFAAGILLGANFSSNESKSQLKTNFFLFTAASLIPFNPLSYIFTTASGVTFGNYIRS